MTAPSGIADERFAAEVEPILGTDTVAERHVVAVLERGDPHLAFIQAVGPLAGRARLRHDDEIGAAERQRPHVFGKVTVVADRHADAARPSCR